MLNRTRIIVAASVAVVLAVALLIGVLLLGRAALTPHPSASSPEPRAAASTTGTAAGSTGSGTPSPTAPAASGSPTASATHEGVESARPLPTLDINDLAQRAALAASSYDAAETPQARAARYRDAYFSDELAATYRPVWATVFGGLTVANIYTATDGPPGLDKASGTEGHHTWRVGVTCLYSGQWIKDGSAHAQPPATSTWFVTIDEATNRVTQIDAPDPATLQVRLN